MAARLTVVVSQAATRDHASTDIEESLIAELMMSPGLDATMIGPIEGVQTEDTDFLCISSFNHSFVIVSWLDAESIQQHWHRLGLDGQIVPAQQLRLTDTQPNRDESKRPIYHLQLRPETVITRALEQIRQVLNHRNVHTVSLSLEATNQQTPNSSPVPMSSPASGTNTNHNENRAPVVQQSGQEQIQRKPDSGPARFPTGLQHGMRQQEVEQDDGDEPAWQHLDQLVEDFDALDL